MKHTYKITGMTCNNCVEKITTTLQKIDQITNVSINFKKNIVDISMKDHVETRIMQEALSKIGNYKISMDTDKMIEEMKKPKNLLKDLKPLFFIVGFIILLTSTVTYFKNGNIFYWMRFFMAHFLIFFGILKFIKLHDFAEAYSQYDIIAKKSKIYGYIYPFLEFSLGILLMIRIAPMLIYSLIAILMFIGSIGVFIKLKEKEEIPCACLGTVFKVPMTWVTLVEDLVMVAMSVFMIISL